MHGQRIGYVRVSSFDQNPERQLEHVQVNRPFTDKASDKDTQRPELERLLAFVRDGDTLVVHSMDRLACNLDDLRRIVRKLTKRGVRIEFVEESLTFTGEDSPMANLMLSVMGAFAEFERALIRRRRGSQNRLGFAVQLCYLRYPGYALPTDAEPRPPCSRSSRGNCASIPPSGRGGPHGRRSGGAPQNGFGTTTGAAAVVSRGLWAATLAGWHRGIGRYSMLTTAAC